MLLASPLSRAARVCAPLAKTLRWRRATAEPLRLVRTMATTGGGSSDDASSARAGGTARGAAGGAPASPADWEWFRRHGHEMVDWIADYYGKVEEYPVKSQVKPGYLPAALPREAPREGEPFADIMADVEEHIVPGVTHWQSPNFFAFFPANSSGPAMLGDMLSSCFGCVSFSWVASPAATELETVVLDWLGRMLGLPDAFLSASATGGGVIQGTASEATLVAVLAARARALARLRDAEPDASARLVAYASDQAHSSVKKACMIAGLGAAQFRTVPTAAGSYRLEADALRAAMEEDKARGLVPFFVCATTGTTSSGAFGPLAALGAVASEESAWLHVDAAWAGSAAICPEYRPLIDGVELADSFAFNPHKWLLTNFDCCAMFVRERKPLLDALSITPEYLRSPEYDRGQVSDYRDWQVPLGRRFRSLKLWFMMRSFGVDKLQEHIRNHVRLGERFAAKVKSDDRFELSAEVSLSLVCFRLRASNEANERMLTALNDSGRLMMVNTVLDGKFVLRFVLTSPAATEEHVDAAWEAITTEAEKILAAEAPDAE